MRSDLDAMVSLARSVNPAALDDPAIRERVADAHTRIEYTKLLNYRALSKILRQEKNWPEVPLAKLQWSYLAQTLAEPGMDLLGPSALASRGADDAIDRGAWNWLYVFQRYTSIGPGRRRLQKHHRRQGDQDAAVLVGVSRSPGQQRPERLNPQLWSVPCKRTRHRVGRIHDVGPVSG
jgi:alkylation response protein AidB-like acyl-CoA dehydrogenase